MASGAAVAGAELVFGGHPADLIKTRQHLSRDPTLSVRQIAQTIYQESGPLGFYTGLRWRILPHAGKSAFRWTAMSQLDTWTKKNIPPPWQPIALAAMIGTAESIITCPAEVLKIREMEQMRSIRTVDFVRSQGVQPLFHGFDAVMFRQFVGWASFLMSYNKMIQWTLSASGKQSKSELSAQEKFIAGAIAGALHVIAVNPIDVIKTQRQKSDPIAGRHCLDAMRSIWKEQGLQPFTRGLKIKIAHSSWYAGINLLAMDKLGVF